MTLVLANRDGEWFLAAFAPHIHGCNLSTTREPRSQSDKFHLWQGRIYVQSHAPVSDIIFYSELYYHGLKVWPFSWDPEAEEPILQCDAMPEDGQLDDEYFQHVLEHSPVDHRGDMMIADGWRRWDKFVYRKAIHVDDLEKVEGLPPEGPF